MELTELLGSSFECACGKQHTVPTEKFIYGEDSFGSIPGLIHTYSAQKSFYHNVPIDRDFFVAVVNHANQMRNRFTILDIAALLGVMPEETEDLIKGWL